MIERFEGEDGKRALIEELRSQAIVLGNDQLSSALAEVAELKELKEGDVLIEQGDEDTEIYFIVTGSFAIKANGRQVANRDAGTHVGEMALIDKKAVRSATVIAATKSVVVMVSERDFSRVANNYPELWRRISVELCDRLRNRNRLIRRPNEIPSVFICSSSESLPYANALRLALDHHSSEVTLWTDQVFSPTKHTMEDLEREVNIADFCIALVMGEDVVQSRKKQMVSPRDNVVFELGLFMGKLGRERTVIVSPRGIDLKLPSDLFGLNPLQFNIPSDLKDPRRISSALGPVCTQLESLINQLGPRC